MLEKAGVLVSRKPKGKAKARSMSGPKHVVFMEEGEEGPYRLFFRRTRAGSSSCRQIHMKGPRTLFLPRKLPPPMVNLRSTWAGNPKAARNERKGNKSPKKRVILIYNSQKKNQRFGVSLSLRCSC